jgi:hypothetical protein
MVWLYDLGCYETLETEHTEWVEVSKVRPILINYACYIDILYRVYTVHIIFPECLNDQASIDQFLNGSSFRLLLK